MSTNTAPPRPPFGDADWLTMDQICARTKTPVDTVYKWSRRGYPFWPRDAVKLPNGAWHRELRPPMRL